VYKQRFKEQLVARMLSANPPSGGRLALETGVPQPTLSRWKKQATTLGGMPENDTPRKPRTPEEKLKIVLEAAAVPEAALGAFLRERGIFEAELFEWRQQALDGLATRGPRKDDRTDKKRIRELERDLRRKEKALAEAAALIVLKKKVLALWGDEGDDTGEKNDD
jgi:hypothetical protein